MNNISEKLPHSPFATGERVKFTTRSGRTILGTIVSTDSNDIVVKTDDGEQIPLTRSVGDNSCDADADADA